ncbi:MAG: vitamin K epoxide reductase family protein [Gemmatimonadetes bacterium]|uniref:Vitamin K epoxide reductase family protein n=1 Tax=Candidatus Kutchimonas denitrificans TaxID=3056748 RepID=A0AAE4ZC89_9BACT|nr:vitamin K epoxide reductase family protein [Gemmatimonadota bacterium]NIR76476.1 vitamin K epoxide reductase family protein [Candidatus Kutchimonas denitrificans]NIS03294.1 vitamin K epoxide reductase family protein [Gemmatimonadota bacterium]NIT69155.1 vitamin K epoxide reductase family protein [Gemmatimonadota bacterium]NIU54547.1 hypothetical protein [Gemmatimonadota bacterium]
MNRRRAIAVLALLGILDSTYLLLAKLGYIGSLSCSISHGCDLVNTSRYSSFLGLPVAGIGLAGYLVLMVIALVGLQPRWLNDPRPDRLLAVLSGVAVAFTLYLTYAEIFWLRAICQWCVVSQVAIIAIFVLSLLGLRRKRQPEIE